MAGRYTSDLRYPAATEIVKFLKLYEWLLDMRIVDFFTENHWNKMPLCWQHSLNGCDLKQLCLVLLSGCSPVQHATDTSATMWPLSLLAFTVCCQMLSVQRYSSISALSYVSDSTVANSNHQLPYSKHIKPKKQHEIKHLSEIVARLADQQKCCNVIDIGSGHGHLARHLAFHHQLNVTTVESDNTHFKLAVKFDREVEQDLEKKARKGVDVRTSGVLNHISHYIRPNISDTEVTELLQQCGVGGADRNEQVLLVGLHTCGDLAPTMLRMFADCHHIAGLVSVGCCYMKLTCATEPHPSTPNGYPLSSKIGSFNGHSLSYEARELSCHALEAYRSRVLSDSEHLKIHCYRAVVQTILKQHNLHRSQLVVAKKTSKLPFEDYAREILASFHLPTELDMSTLGPLLDRWEEVVIMYMLRLAIAPCVESIILLDRIFYLKEHGYDAMMIPLFDPTISPRNFVIVAHK